MQRLEPIDRTEQVENLRQRVGGLLEQEIDGAPEHPVTNLPCRQLPQGHAVGERKMPDRSDIPSLQPEFQLLVRRMMDVVVFTRSGVRFFSAAARSASHSEVETAIGFSSRVGTPASNSRAATSKCRGGGTRTCAASMLSDSSSLARVG